MKIAIIATGDEIVHGDTLNTNACDLAQILNAEGFPPDIHLACCDSEQQMIDSLHWLSPDYNLIIFIGGLGPTSDDRTRFALATFLGRPLLEYPEAIRHIQERFQQTDIKLNAGNRQQALFPESTRLLPNPFGSAMGGYYKDERCLYVLLPGPPRECLPMFNQQVMPMLHGLQHSDRALLKWRLFGVAESIIGEILDNALADLPCETGYRLEIPYVEFKVRCDKALATEVKRRIEPLIAPYIIATIEQKASDKLRQWFDVRKIPATIIDDATGGILQTLIQRPENHAFLHFHADENKDLTIKIKGLAAYWTQENQILEVNLDIALTWKGKTQKESHLLQYRSALIIHYAAELACYRIFEMLEKEATPSDHQQVER